MPVLSSMARIRQVWKSIISKAEVLRSTVGTARLHSRGGRIDHRGPRPISSASSCNCCSLGTDVVVLTEGLDEKVSARAFRWIAHVMDRADRDLAAFARPQPKPLRRLPGIHPDQPFETIDPVHHLGVAMPWMTVAGIQRVLDDADIRCLRDYF